ncbi:hypothetical protein B0H63DRAFT_463959 [Podospora didyma]|uniref:Uncharacterized protein n=1 Tax=Podospora didyma TaxID=330526 RepID=A0AAE0U3T6_9PEZI|nr:hypothetical protein B0H63DRAFT_463959 [Podospora didyma]
MATTAPPLDNNSSSSPRDLPPPFDDEPPSYREQNDDPDEILQPTVFILQGQSIHAESADSPPLYELSREIHAQGAATGLIELERIDRRIRTSSDGTPAAVVRRKDIYTLNHLLPLWAVEYLCKIEPATRKGLGEVGFKKSPFPHTGYRAVQVLSQKEEKNSKSAAAARQAAKHDCFFVVKDKKNGVYEWCDPEGKVVATQDSADGGTRTGQYKLLVAVPLSRRMMDGLVALWCLWLWHLHTVEIREKMTWKDVKRIMQKPRTFKGGFM